ncbi:MAG: ATP-binding cassette domain-containing protein [Selenomonas sp.]|uniref:ATP-binding cassette domain-containing protein n=1 Tax=Selenomonas sp. TaxID=2053611 RepID=UPI0026010D26|nr:ATP-binding cassette domain-containing protein [Selenomonas sp.]MCI6233443.1 ATP-binding cassette domain-containing protein [Selenomonas sp.]
MTISDFFRQELSRGKRTLARLACLHLFAGLLTILGAFCTAQILACAVDGTLHETFIEKAVPLFGVLLFVVLGKWGLDLPERNLRGRLLIDAQERLRHRIHAAFFARSPLALSPATGGELLGLSCEGADRLHGVYEKTLPVLLGIAVRMPLLLIALALADPWTGLLALITLPIAPFLLYLIGRVTKERSTREWNAMVKMGSAFAELLHAIPMLKLFQREQAEAARVAKASDAFTRAALSVLETAFVSAFALELITTLSIALIAVSLGFRLIGGEIAFAPAFFALLLAPEFYAPLAAGGTSFHAGMEAASALKPILKFIKESADLKIFSRDSEDKLSQDEALEETGDAIRFDNVTCCYLGRKAPAVHDLAFSVPRGKVTLLAGTSGAGKSTVFALALGFLTPDEGNISRNFDGPAAYVPQEPNVFAGTLRENLLLGRNVADNALLNAMERAGLASLLARLPRGLDTMLGEGGRMLSAGERRRLGLARALVVPRKLYLLDEPTAGLDEENEKVVLKTIRGLVDGKGAPAVLVASHREKTVEIADRIVRLDGGTVVSKGKNRVQLAHLTTLSVAYGDSSFWKETCTSRNDSHDLRFGKNQVRPEHPTTPSVACGDSSLWEGACLQKKFSAFFSLIRMMPLGLSLPALLSGVLADGAAVLLLGASAWLITTAAFHPHLYMLAVAITGVRASGIGRAVFRYLDRYLSHRAVFTLLTRLRLAVYNLACQRLPERTPGPASGAFLQSASTGVDELRDFYLRALFPLVRILAIAAITAYLAAREGASFSAALAAAESAFIPSSITSHGETLFALLPIACILLLVLVTYLSHHDGQADAAMTEYRSGLLDAFAGRAEIAAFRTADWMTGRLDRHAAAITRARRNLLRRDARADASASALPRLAWLLLFMLLALAFPSAPTQADAVHLAVCVLVFGTLMDLFVTVPEVIRAIPSALKQAQILIASAEETSFIMKHPAGDSPRPSGPSPLWRGAPHKDKAPSPILSSTSLTFSYAHLPPLFHDLSFTVTRGEKFLLLGESGAGKTTLFHILTRLWEPDSGMLSLAGRPYADLSTTDVRSAFAAATQAGVLLSGSIRENFDRFVPGLTDDDRRRAIELAALAPVINDLPQGERTPLGEDACRLSGGQRQRLLVALALARFLAGEKNGQEKILLLDEPTTGIDRKTAGSMLQGILSAFPQATMLLILHDRELSGLIAAREDAHVQEL